MHHNMRHTCLPVCVSPAGRWRWRNGPAAASPGWHLPVTWDPQHIPPPLQVTQLVCLSLSLHSHLQCLDVRPGQMFVARGPKWVDSFVWICMIVKQPQCSVSWIKKGLKSLKLQCVEMYFRRAASGGGRCATSSPHLDRQQLVLRLLQLFLLPSDTTLLWLHLRQDQGHSQA